MELVASLSSSLRRPVRLSLFKVTLPLPAVNHKMSRHPGESSQLPNTPCPSSHSIIQWRRISLGVCLQDRLSAEPVPSLWLGVMMERSGLRLRRLDFFRTKKSVSVKVKGDEGKRVGSVKWTAGQADSYKERRV